MAKKDARTMNPPKETKISDLQLAAFLLARDFDLVRTEGSSPRTQFIFSNVSDEEVFSFYRGEPLVNARRLFDCYRNLRGLLHQRGDGRR